MLALLFLACLPVQHLALMEPPGGPGGDGYYDLREYAGDYAATVCEARVGRCAEVPATCEEAYAGFIAGACDHYDEAAALDCIEALDGAEVGCDGIGDAAFVCGLVCSW